MVVRVGNTYYNVKLEPVLVALGVLVVLILANTAVFTVPVESEAVVLRFGKYARTAKPGLNFKLPFGIEKQKPVQVRRQLKQEFGFGTEGATNPKQSALGAEQERERNMVTGDKNAATVEWVIQYRISDAKAYLFNVYYPDDNLRAVSESVMREVVGDRTVDEVITIGRRDIQQTVERRLQELVDDYQMGLSIDQVQLKNVNPPPDVQPSFNEVNQAQQQREKSINLALGQQSEVIPRARGEAEGKRTEALGYAVKRRNEALGDAERFNALFKEYQKAPEVTRRRIYLETMMDILPRLQRKIVLDDEAKQILPLLNLNSGGAR
ncbi:MAG: FtsH protease activity modulator HflK [Verrucomicrobiales bacterium]|nr:FtsH protease activity modulator HflK [Verrucomicrobiales bacterium]|tara:strand:+ start:25072 stop:26040 length:969 start_codon:yes stop_codon:yes gene_type:complete